MSEETKKDEDIGCSGMITLVVIGATFSFIITMAMVHHFWVIPLQSKAVEMGVADWLVNPKDGTTKFTWKEKKP